MDHSPDGPYLQAERQYLSGNTKQAVHSLEKLFSSPDVNENPHGLVKAHNLRGLIFFQEKNILGAIKEFETATTIAQSKLDAKESVFQLAKYNLANADFQLSRKQEAFEVLAGVIPEALDPDTRMRFHHLYGNVLASREDHVNSLIEYLRAADLAKDVGARDTFLQKALSASKKVFLKDPQADLEKFQSLGLSENTPSGIAVQVLVGRGQMFSGKIEQAKLSLKKVLTSSNSSHPFYSKAEEMLADLEKISDVRANTIGVLLPLSGKFGKFGRLCLNSLTLALGVYENMKQPEGAEKIKLAIRDTGESPESAVEAFESLIKEEKAIAVVGPLLSKQFASVSRKAQEFGVPLFSLSQKVESDQLGSYIFPIALTPDQQIQMAVTHAIEVRGLKNFAILAPEDNFGNEYMNLFWNEVEKHGGEIVGVERYQPKSTDFRDELNRLLGLDYLGARKTEIEEMKRREELYASTLKVKGKLRKRFLQVFEPKAVADFDAVFIPDDPSTVGQIVPAFAVKEIDNLPFIGINSWNSPEIVQRAGKYLQDSIFVDGFFAGNKNQRALDFVQEYTNQFQSVPGTIEVQAYDAASILMETLRTRHPESRLKLREELVAIGKFYGISGNFQFAPEGVKRDAHLLTIKGSNIVEIREK